jgi:Anti-sigma factor NepR
MANKIIRSQCKLSCASAQGKSVRKDDAPSQSGKPRPKVQDASALPEQLGHKLRTLFSDVESQPVPDRLREVLELLAAKEKKPE